MERAARYRTSCEEGNVKSEADSSPAISNCPCWVGLRRPNFSDPISKRRSVGTGNASTFDARKRSEASLPGGNLLYSEAGIKVGLSAITKDYSTIYFK